MKKRVYVSGFLLCLILISMPTGIQAQDSNYLKLDYIEVQNNQITEYLELIENVWKPIQQQWKNSGDISEWYLYKVNYSGGSRHSYNFVTVTIVNSLDKLEKIGSSGRNAPEVSTNQTQNIVSLREVLFSEIWKVENSVSLNNSNDTPPRYLVMDYMNVNPGKDFDYLMLEDDVAKPIHEERITQDIMRNWEVYSLIIPGGTNYGYNYATGNYFDSLSSIEFGFTEEIVKQALPGTNLPELFDLIFETRELVNHELWEVVTYVK